MGRHSFWIKTAQAALLVTAICFSLGATDAGTRYNNLNHRMMCTCGCAQILGECNHVGCPNSSGELSELRTGIQSGLNDQQILDSFVAKYGAVVLAAPTGHVGRSGRFRHLEATPRRGFEGNSSRGTRFRARPNHQPPTSPGRSRRRR